MIYSLSLDPAYGVPFLSEFNNVMISNVARKSDENIEFKLEFIYHVLLNHSCYFSLLYKFCFQIFQMFMK